MLADGLIWGLVGVSSQRLVGILVGGLVGVLVGPEVICVLVVGLVGVNRLSNLPTIRSDR
jgi:uncharacterized membrane protein YuzA (DUF378 family)